MLHHNYKTDRLSVHERGRSDPTFVGTDAARWVLFLTARAGAAAAIAPNRGLSVPSRIGLK